MVLFQSDFCSDVSIDDTIKQYYTIDSEDKEDGHDEEPEIKLSQSDRKYIESVVDGVSEHKQELDDIISGYSKGWTVERLIKVDASVLRYGIYEMKYMADVTPPEVSINEAVELSKKYGTDKSKAFVNGVLSSYYKELKGAV